MDNIRIIQNDKKSIQELIESVEHSWIQYLVQLVFDKKTNPQYAIGISYEYQTGMPHPITLVGFKWIFENDASRECVAEKYGDSQSKIIAIITLEKNDPMKSFVKTIEKLKKKYKYEYTPTFA